MPTSIKPLTGKDVFDLAQAAGIASSAYGGNTFEECADYTVNGPSDELVKEACEKAAADFNEKNASDRHGDGPSSATEDAPAMLTTEEMEKVQQTLPVGVSLRVCESAVPERGLLCVVVRSPIDAWSAWCGPKAEDVQAEVDNLRKYLKVPPSP